MATSFPSGLDSFTNPTAVDTLDSPPHDTQHADANDAIEAIETALLDGAPLHIDDANERVGVGNVSPSYKLDVTGDINASGVLRIGGAVVGEYVNYSASQTFNNFTIGNGTVDSRYARIGDMVHWHGFVILGSTSSMSGPLDPNLPVAGGAGIIKTVGSCYFNNGVNGFYGGIIPILNTVVRFQYWNFGSPGVFGADVTSGLPFTWGAGHLFAWNYFYEAL